MTEIPTPQDHEDSHSADVHVEGLTIDVQRAGDALLGLGTSGASVLAGRLARLTQVIAAEAARTPRFAKALSKALEETSSQNDPGDPRPVVRHGNRRNPGVLDPFAIFADDGEAGLRERLTLLSLEELKDIIAENGMDHDRLAMKWKDSSRVVARIVERVIARSTKGSAFRGKPDG